MERGLQSPLSSRVSRADVPFQDAEPCRAARCTSTPGAPSPDEHAAMRPAPGANPRAHAALNASTDSPSFGAKSNTNFRHTWRFWGSVAPLAHGCARSMRTTNLLRTSPGCRPTNSRVPFRFRASEPASEINQGIFRSIRRFAFILNQTELVHIQRTVSMKPTSAFSICLCRFSCPESML